MKSSCWCGGYVIMLYVKMYWTLPSYVRKLNNKIAEFLQKVILAMNKKGFDF